jgi:hypothetical protein
VEGMNSYWTICLRSMNELRTLVPLLYNSPHIVRLTDTGSAILFKSMIFEGFSTNNGSHVR